MKYLKNEKYFSKKVKIVKIKSKNSFIDNFLEWKDRKKQSLWIRFTFLTKQIENNRYVFRIDACESKVEIVTPYWASNSAGKIRAIVNTQHFEQAIHQEVCS